MKIKIIDLLVKIANGEESTKVKTKYNSSDWEINDFLLSIYNEFDSRNNAEIVEFLNDYVEIIEEPKKIEKITWSEKESLAGEFTASGKQNILARRTEKLKSSLNELIDEINNLKEK